MMPEAIRAKALLVDKGVACLDVLNLSHPLEVNRRRDLDAVDNDRAGIDRSFWAAFGGESEVRWSDFIEVMRMGEECPRFFSRDGEELFLFQAFHA